MHACILFWEVLAALNTNALIVDGSAVNYFPRCDRGFSKPNFLQNRFYLSRIIFKSPLYPSFDIFLKHVRISSSVWFKN